MKVVHTSTHWLFQNMILKMIVTSKIYSYTVVYLSTHIYVEKSRKIKKKIIMYYSVFMLNTNFHISNFVPFPFIK